MTRYERFKARWIGCTECSLCETRKRVCLLRGRVPAQVLFVGEAPGESEDVLGKPFVGPAGKLLDQIIARALPSDVTYALTNLICCMPRKDGKKANEPSVESIRACAGRLKETVRLVRPEIIVTIGKLAETYVPALLGDIINGCMVCSIIHPAAILRADASQQGLAIQRCMAIISDAVYDWKHVPF